MKRLSRLVVLVLVPAALFACKGEKTPATQAPEQAPAAQAPAAPAAPASDAKGAQTERNAKVVPFSELFTANADGSVSPKQQIVVNGATIAAGTVCGKGTQYGGMDLAAMKGKKLLVSHKGNAIILKGAME